MKKLLLTFFLSSISLGVLAKDCEQANKSPTDIATCYEKSSFNKVSTNLAKLKEISKTQLSYNKNVLVELNNSQTAWLKYRDSYCDSYSNYHDELNNHSNCIVNMNNQRAEQLQQDINAN
ncbi:lysozyme inhibitor LprI family protein [uncultured Acinetobacter sp.]|uniref:lysozyme inhibitor LprI family protein n=1 Tax=uncultured Acinetobacter sp. TaxID=165433 RepID=UPI0025890D9F|nr:lysozyme inhibitor LprI family protein [uncultured Acinetobacter sp.]